MPHSTQKPVSPPQRMASYRQRIRESGLQPVQIWVPDTRSPDFVETCRRQARAVAAHGPAGEEMMRFVADVYVRAE